MIACTIKNIHLLTTILGRFRKKGVLSLGFVSFTTTLISTGFQGFLIKFVR